MTQYAALIYSVDVDWTLPEYADDHGGVRGLRRGRRGAVIRGGAALYPTSTATTRAGRRPRAGRR